MIKINKMKKKTAVIMAFLMVCLFLLPFSAVPVCAKDSFLAGYMQTVYNQKNGIGSNEINCLYQSSTGYVWAGTDGGLYRTNGSDFQSIDLWDTERTDLYSINCIMQDQSGRMWIGTDNYGLFYIEDGENHHLQDEYYNGTKTILDIAQAEDGTIYVACVTGLYMIGEAQKDERSDDSDFMLQAYPDDKITSMEFLKLTTRKNEVWAITGTGIYVFDSTGLLHTINLSEQTSEELSTIKTCGDSIYVGTSGRDVFVYKDVHSRKDYVTGVDAINDFMLDTEGRIWVCADNGYGYFDSQYNFVHINDSQIDTYISAMIQDYEGNFWIASSRVGLLLLTPSKFVDYNMEIGMPEGMVNAVYEFKGKKYIATEEGLYIYNSKNEQQTNELTEMLKGVSVRHVVSDEEGTIWISTYRKYGVIKYEKNGTITSYGRYNGLPAMAVNCSLPLKDGDLAVATTDGVAILDESGFAKKVYGSGTALSEVNVLSLFETEQGSLLVGTDGAGIFVIDSGRNNLMQYGMEDGLNSEVISCFVQGTQGIWIGTDSGVCFYNEAFRMISNIEYSNSVYDIVIEDGLVWIIGSMGVLCTSEDELLGSNGISGRYYSTGDGLDKTINTTGNVGIDKSGRMYICCNEGISVLDTKHIWKNETKPKIKVTKIDIDGKIYEFDDLNDGLKIKSDTSKITIDFAVFSYQNRGNMKVEYYLSGFDANPTGLSGNDVLQAVYTNLDGGVYRFNINAYNGDGTPCAEPISFVIEKEKRLLENTLARIALVVIILFGFLLLMFAVLRVRRLLRTKTSALEQLSKEHEEVVKSSTAKTDYLANMSNEIKTPIHAMMVKADELLHMVDQDSPYQKEINSIYEMGSDILSSVDDIILLAKLESGRIEIEESNYSVSDIVAELSDIAIKQLADKPVKFFVEINRNVVDNLIGDSDKIRNILIRLLDNAVRYTKQGSITLSVDSYEYTDRANHDKLNIVYTLSDTGIGIQEDKIDTIFNLYERDEGTKSGSRSGRGVGLAIAKGYADILSADISVESAYGAGSTFVLSIDQRPAVKLSSGQVVSKIEDTVSKEDAEKLWLPDVSALIVDDDEVSIEVSRKVLSAFDMKLDVATSGLGAIDMVLNHDYDVVFMDLAMPIMNGIEAMKEIRDLDGMKYAILPIIALDPDALESNRSSNLTAGFTDSLIKPIELRRVAAILKDCLPQDKVKERSDDIRLLIEGSRFGKGLIRLSESLDVEGAIQKIGGSIEVYNKLIHAFYAQNKDVAQILTEKSTRDIRGFKVRIHSIRTLANSIGAYELAENAAHMETSIHVGKREQLKQSLRGFIDELVYLLLILEDYEHFADEVSGMTDEEYAERLTQQRLEEEELSNEDGGSVSQNEETVNLSVIDIRILEQLCEAVKQEDTVQAGEWIGHLLSMGYDGDNREFLNALKEVVDANQADAVEELVNTYKDLKL